MLHERAKARGKAQALNCNRHYPKTTITNYRLLVISANASFFGCNFPKPLRSFTVSDLLFPTLLQAFAL